MPSFDPAIATATYLAQLPPTLQASAAAYTAGSNWIGVWSTLISMIGAWLVLRSGLMVRVREKIGHSGKRPNLAAFACGVTFFLLTWAIKLPWSTYTDWARERSYGQSHQLFGAWFGQSAIQSVFSAIFGGMLILCLYALIRKAGKTWWIYAAGLGGIVVFLALVIQPIVLGPVFNDFKPAPGGAVRTAVAELAMRVGVPADRIVIYDGSKQSARFTAHVDGIGPIARVALSDTMFRHGADLGATRAVTAHELGHYKHLDAVQLSLALGILFLFATWAIARLFTPVSNHVGVRQPYALADPAGLPIIVALFAFCGLALTPAINTVQRHVELSADRFGLELARDPDGAARALLASADYRASSPSPLQEFVFYNHPSVARRIRNAMDWKAAHLADAEPGTR